MKIAILEFVPRFGGLLMSRNRAWPSRELFNCAKIIPIVNIIIISSLLDRVGLNNVNLFISKPDPKRSKTVLFNTIRIDDDHILL